MTTVTCTSGAEPVSLVGGRWRVLREIARGGMGVVFEGVDVVSGEAVAIKILREGADSMAVARFVEEARSAVRIDSPHVVRIVGSGLIGDRQPFLVMELLNGEDLGAYVARKGALPLEEAATYAVQACEALGRAHAVGVVHRDIKPSNLFRHVDADGRVVLKIVDFGISKSFVREETLTSSREGSILGSPPYMSPEQIRDARNVDARSDLWSLGVVVYRLLTNQTPWTATRIDEVFAQILAAKGLPTLADRGLPRALDDILSRCVAPNPDDRWPDADALARAISIFSSVTSTVVLACSGEALPTVAIQTIRHEPSSSAKPRVAEEAQDWRGWALAAAFAMAIAGGTSLTMRRPASATATATTSVSAAEPAASPAIAALPPLATMVAMPIAPPPHTTAPTPRRVVVVPVRQAPAERTSAPKRELQPNPYATEETR